MHQYEQLYNHGFMDQKTYDHIQAACILGYFSETCIELRAGYDEQFASYRTSIMNLYAPCYEEGNSTQKKVRQSGGFKDIDEGACDDDVGINYFFNEPMMAEALHVKNI